ncbi:MAG: phosphodiester glycosidase family protein [Bacteroidales bacterium]|nr:phosphodiester glycosidase family protein [Bacteroidales bacterium]
MFSKPHKKLLLPIALLLALMPAACCQQVAEPDYTADSIRFAAAEWRTDSLDGFVLRRYHFGHAQLFGTAQNMSLIEIPKGSPRRLHFVCDTAPAPVSQLAGAFSGLAAVNGSYFDMERGNPICYLRIDGLQLGENIPNAGDSLNRKYYQHAALVLADGLPRILLPDSNRLWEDSLPHADVMTAGPMLIRHGQLVPQRTDRTFVTKRHNRTALGLRPDGTVLLLTVDGRSRRRSEGLSLDELEHVMRWLGCREAINLDGGGSTTMYVQGFPHNGVVNYPSDNNRFDHEGERPVANAIVVR